MAQLRHAKRGDVANVVELQPNEDWQLLADVSLERVGRPPLNPLNPGKRLAGWKGLPGDTGLPRARMGLVLGEHGSRKGAVEGNGSILPSEFQKKKYENTAVVVSPRLIVYRQANLPMNDTESGSVTISALFIGPWR